ncbi:unnamed protein product [Cuscuta campestris]|uniref:Uncharacterized protein n=1 Tax=Cuscuta campestris TaxID=132261 RepID=A0A484N2V1_9ASTE|nr:unnamed protein product [Cuscuta campestris]
MQINQNRKQFSILSSPRRTKCILHPHLRLYAHKTLQGTRAKRWVLLGSENALRLLQKKFPNGILWGKMAQQQR